MNVAKEVIHQDITIATGSSRLTTKWKHKDYTWKGLIEELSTTQRTKETYDEYRNMSRRERGKIKDVGGFVGGTLKGGRRRNGHVAWRHLITLDVDHADTGFWGLLTLLFDYTCVLYSTHSHSPENPRYRLIIPLSRPIKSEQYEPISRMIADLIDIEAFDHTTYQPHRLMYWPSTAKDAEYVFQYQNGKAVDPDEILEKYKLKGKNWQDPFHWPRHSKEKQKRQSDMDKAGDPLEKPGIIGAFNRVYSIHEAIDTFIDDKYTQVEENRYTYTDGSTYGGLVVYGDGTFAYSHHESDPCGLQLVNAFDMVRLHMFSDEDLDAKPGTPINRLPSYKLMTELANDDKDVSIEMSKHKLEEAGQDFDIDDNMEWLAKLKKNAKGNLVQSIENGVIILQNDKYLKGRLGINQFSGMPSIIDDLPWRKRQRNDHENIWSDSDQAYLLEYLESYGLTSVGKITPALEIVFEENKFHPVRDYLTNLEWDGKERLERLFIDYLGAEDTRYTRAVTRKALTACVARVFEPGCKVDNLIVLIGSQGIGKSTILDKLGKQWFSDSLDSMKGKDAYGQLRGSWIIELGELTATRKSDVETIKHFISKRRDDYRRPYDKYESSIPRQCVFFGTTNDFDFLNDPTGNRRFWPVETEASISTKNVWNDLDDELNQIWAEAVHLYKEGAKLWLEPELRAKAIEVQEKYTQENPLAGQIREYLETEVPKNWYDMSTLERQSWSDMSMGDESQDKIKLDQVCAQMIWVEALGKNLSDMNRYDAREINTILQNTPGWDRVSSVRFNEYGRQRGFKRK